MMRPPPLSGDTKYMKLISWNVNGLRALLKLEGFSALELAQREEFDVLCLQETKLKAKPFHLQSYSSHILFKVTCTSNETLSSYRGQEKDVEAIKQCLLDGYDNSFWTCSVSKLGYSGTAIISRVCIFNLPSFDHIAIINFFYHFLFLLFLLVPSLNGFAYCFMVSGKHHHLYDR